MEVTDAKAKAEPRSAEPAPVPATPSSPWRDLFIFRGAAQPRQELWLGIGAFVLVLVVWSMVAELGLVKPQFLPSPSAVVAAWFRLFSEAGYTGDIAISVARVWAAFLASAVIAIPLGILMSGYRVVTAVTEPIIDFVRYLPVPALVPLTIIWLGIGEGSKIALLWLGTFFQLVLLVADDARRVPREYIEIGLTTGAKPRQILGSIVLPAMLPSMVDNLRITLGWCWTYLIIAEIVAADSGIGYVIMSARRYVKTDEVMAGILAIGIIGLATDQAIRWLHRRCFVYLT